MKNSSQQKKKRSKRLSSSNNQNPTSDGTSWNMIKKESLEKRITVRVPASLYEALKKANIDIGKSVRKLLEDAVKGS